MENDYLKIYLIFCAVLISIAIVVAMAFEPKQQIKINADEKYSRIILSALNNTDKNVTKHITSITVVDDSSLLGKMSCMQLYFEVGGCAATVFYGDNSFKTDIYLASERLLKGYCNTFENVVYHEIGHVVYFHKYGKAGTYQTDQEPYAISYANRFAKDNCRR